MPKSKSKSKQRYKSKKSDLKVQNIVATSSLGNAVPLIKLAKSDANTEYHPETFPGLILRVKKPKSAVLVFASGNLVCTGTKSIAQVKEVIANVISRLHKIGVKVSGKPKVNVQNIVASGSINFTLNLNILALKLGNTEYEPEQFPGLVYKLSKPYATFLLFSNGKLVCTGTKNREELNNAKTQLLHNIKEAMKGVRK